MERLAQLIAPDVIWHVPGNNVISGTYTSRDSIFGCFNKIYELTGGTYKPELLDILADDTYTVAILHGHARRGEKTLDQDYAFICRIRDGQIAELQEAWTEGPAWNEFWSKPSARWRARARRHAAARVRLDSRLLLRRSLFAKRGLAPARGRL